MFFFLGGRIEAEVEFSRLLLILFHVHTAYAAHKLSMEPNEG